ncbi:MAG: hypothetical protein ACR2KP_08710 [Egibacteraceae bacterium]
MSWRQRGVRQVQGGEASFERVLAAAARLQSLVPDAILVGGTASALYARHRVSFDDDHVLADLAGRFDDVLATLEASDGWVTERVRPGRVILGNLDGIETGVLQLRRSRPLEVVELTVEGHTVRVPTDAEMVRVKAWMVVWRNATRDFLDVVALAGHLGRPVAAATLARMDDYYADQREGGRGITTQLVRALADPRPYDLDLVDLAAYRRLVEPWRDWDAVRAASTGLSGAILDCVAEEEENP